MRLCPNAGNQINVCYVNIGAFPFQYPFIFSWGRRVKKREKTRMNEDECERKKWMIKDVVYWESA